MFSKASMSNLLKSAEPHDEYAKNLWASNWSKPVASYDEYCEKLWAAATDPLSQVKKLSSFSEKQKDHLRKAALKESPVPERHIPTLNDLYFSNCPDEIKRCYSVDSEGRVIQDSICSYCKHDRLTDYSPRGNTTHTPENVTNWVNRCALKTNIDIIRMCLTKQQEVMTREIHLLQAQNVGWISYLFQIILAPFVWLVRRFHSTMPDTIPCRDLELFTFDAKNPFSIPA